MDGMILFLIKSIMISGLLTALYCIGLRNNKLHQYNRFFLLLVLVASLTVPLLHVNWFTIQGAPPAIASPANYLVQTINSDGEQESHAAARILKPSVNWYTLFERAIIAISIAQLIVLWIRIWWIFRLAGRQKITEADGIKWVLTDHPKAPFHFLIICSGKRLFHLTQPAGD